MDSLDPNGPWNLYGDSAPTPSPPSSGGGDSAPPPSAPSSASAAPAPVSPPSSGPVLLPPATSVPASALPDDNSAGVSFATTPLVVPPSQPPHASDPSGPWNLFATPDAQQPAASAPAAAAAPTTTPPPSTMSDVGTGLATGIVKGTAGLAGMAGDVQRMSNTVWDHAALWAAHKAFDATGYGPQAGTPERDAFDKLYLAMGQDPSATVPTSSDVLGGIEAVGGKLPSPQTTAGHYAETVGEFIPGAALGPESVAKKVALGAVVPGVASETAGQMAQGTAAEPYARMVGAIAGTGVAAAAHTGLTTANKVAAPIVAKGLDAVGLPAMQERLAGQALMSKASDPIAFRDTLLNPNAPDEIVPGSKPTTYQLTGDQGIGQAERADSRVNPAPYNELREAQNSARLAAIPTQTAGDPTATVAHYNDQLASIDSRAQQRVDALADTARQGASNIGTGAAPDVVGGDIRNVLDTANQASKANERALWQAVDPDGTLANSTGTIGKANSDIYGSLTPEAQAFVTPEEKTFSGLISAYKPVEPFQRVADLRSNLAAAMRSERATSGDTPAYARMSQLMGAVQDTINTAIEGRAAQDAHAVSMGTLAPENTVDARVRQWVSDQFERQQQGRLASNSQNTRGASGSGSTSDVGLRGASGEEPQGRGSAAGNARISPANGTLATGALAPEPPSYGDRTISAQMHAPETVAALGQDVPGTVVRPFGSPLDPVTGQARGMVAFHGTPHDFERFSSEHIGAGEGNQSYGHGLYFAENENIAKNYRDVLSNRDATFRLGPIDEAGAQTGFNRNDFAGQEHRDAVDHLIDNKGDIDLSLRESQKAADQAKTRGDAEDAAKWQQRADIFRDFMDQGFQWGGSRGNLYQVKIARSPEHFLDWDKPIGEQTPYVQRAFKDIPNVDANTSGSDAYLQASRAAPTASPASYRGDPAGGAKLLADKGIAGIRYLDGGSRSAGEGTSNFVTFRDSDLVITHKNGAPLAQPVTLPDYLRGEAVASFGQELSDAGMSPASFSNNLRGRAGDLLARGERLDQGRALEDSHIDQTLPKDIADAVDAGATQASRSDVPRAGGVGNGSGQESSTARAGFGRGSASQAGGAPGQVLTPNFDQAAGDRLRAASDATKENRQTFGKGAVGQVLQPGQMKGEFKLPLSAVPGKVFPAGTAGADGVRSYYQAAGSGPEARQALENAAMEKLRLRIAPRDDGMLPEAALQSFKREHATALSAVDEVSPGFSSRFDDAAKATTAVQQAVAQKQALLKAYQTSALGKIMKAGSEDEVVNRVGTMLNAPDRVSQIGQLVRGAQNSPDAMAGLKKAVSDAMAKQFMTQTEAGSSGEKLISADKFKRMVADKTPALSQIYSPEEMDNLRLVAADLDRSNRSVSGSKLPGGSDTAQNQAQIDKGSNHGSGHGLMGGPPSFLGSVIAGSLAAEHVPYLEHLGPIGGGIAGGATYLLKKVRDAGIHDVQGLVSDALQNPDRARQYVRRVRSDEERRWTGQILARSFLQAPIASQQQAHTR